MSKQVFDSRLAQGTKRFETVVAPVGHFFSVTRQNWLTVRQTLSHLRVELLIETKLCLSHLQAVLGAVIGTHQKQTNTRFHLVEVVHCRAHMSEPLKQVNSKSVNRGLERTQTMDEIGTNGVNKVRRSRSWQPMSKHASLAQARD